MVSASARLSASIPSPPALETAAASAGHVASPMGACTIGKLIRNSWFKDVWMVRITLASVARPLASQEVNTRARWHAAPKLYVLYSLEPGSGTSQPLVSERRVRASRPGPPRAESLLSHVPSARQHGRSHGDAILQCPRTRWVVQGSLHRLRHYHRLRRAPFLGRRYAVPSEKLRRPLRSRHPPHPYGDASLGIVEVEDGPLLPVGPGARGACGYRVPRQGS